MAITHLFFDLGSTLLDETAAVQARVERTVERLRGTPQECSLKEFWARMDRAARREAHPYALVMQLQGGAGWEPWPKNLEQVYPGTPELLAQLRKTYRLGVIANQHRGIRERLEAYGLAVYFDDVASSAEEGVAKPNPRIFELALSRAGCAPAQAVMIGDRLDNDVAPAKRLGMRTVWVRQGWGGLAELPGEEFRPDAAVSCLADLPAALASLERSG
ncbi:MAG: HAD family hydrolase [Oscillospiraceae bacterium]|jgi:HAD superfamily hydrolase (TIGR01662 family)|nr:HAD family hydrolase [Oscillospiraceae bacterium]